MPSLSPWDGWFQPPREQAGSPPGNRYFRAGCRQIVSLAL